MYSNPLLLQQQQNNPLFRRLMIQGIQPPQPTIPGQDEGQQPLYGQGVQDQPPVQPPSLMERISALMQENKPNTSRYNDYVQKGPPNEDNYKPSGWRKFGALAATALNAYGGDPNAVKTGQAILEKPFSEAMGKYGREGAHLKEASQVEESAWQHRLDALKAQGAEENRVRDDERQSMLANSLITERTATIVDLARKAAQANLGLHTDKDTGEAYIVKPDGTRISAGKFDQSTGERIAEAGEKAKQSSALTLGREKAMAGISFGNAKALEDVRQGNRIELADKRNTAAADRLQTRLKARIAEMKPGTATDATRRQLLNLQAAIAADPSMADVDIDSMLVKGQTGIIQVAPDKSMFGESPEVKAVKEKLRTILATPSKTPEAKKPFKDPQGLFGGQ